MVRRYPSCSPERLSHLALERFTPCVGLTGPWEPHAEVPFVLEHCRDWAFLLETWGSVCYGLGLTAATYASALRKRPGAPSSTRGRRYESRRLASSWLSA